MRLLCTLLCAVAATALATAPASASHRYDVRIGIGDQNASMFEHPAFQDLGLRQVRYVIPWNAISDDAQRLKARAWVKRARRDGLRPLIHISTDTFEAKAARLPTTREYNRSVGRLVRYFRRLGVRDFGVWNEANHKTQPTYRSPWRAARFFKLMRRMVFRGCSARSCRVVGLDVLDQPGVERYIDRFIRAVGRRYASRYLRIVGIHNYSDVNRRSTTRLRRIRTAIHRHTRRPNLWLTETGGLVGFGRNFPCSERRAAKRLDFLFDTVRRYRRDIQRVYLYNWTGSDCRERFDAGLVRADGSVRPGFEVVERAMRRFKR